MKVFITNRVAMLLLAAAALWQSGCGGSSGVNQIVDTVTPGVTTVIAGTTQVFTSTVTGSTNIDSTWSCTYMYTPAPTQSVPNPKPTTAANCSSGQTVNGGSIGTWTTNQTNVNNTLSYTAPATSNFPNPIPVITFTAAAAANTGKKGTATVTLDTGIRIAVNPTSATAPVGITPAQQIQFTAQLASGPPTGLNWQVMQPVLGSSTQICTSFPSLVSGGACGTANPQGATCSPGCGSIDTNTGIYTAPSSMPTDTAPVTSGSNAATAAISVTVVVWKSGDIFHYATATITLVNSSTNPITFTGIHPTTIAAGGVVQDIWLDAKNILNTTPISFTSPTGQTTAIDPTNIFTVPITADYCTPSAANVTPVVTCDASITTRVRLQAAQLASAGTGSITVSNIPTTSGQTQSISFPITLTYTKPAVVAAVPDSFPQATPLEFAVDGGYYGATGSLVEFLFNNNLNVVDPTSGPRQVSAAIQGAQTQSPGLYPVSVSFTAPTSTPPPYTFATTNVAVQPSFATLSSTYFSPGTTTTNPQQIVAPPAIALPTSGGVTNLAPSAMALNSNKGYAVITEQASNSIQLVDLAPQTNGRFAPVMVGGPVAVGNQPTGVAIDPGAYNGDDLGVVVNTGDSTLTLLDLTPSTATNLGTISLSGLLQESSAPPPFSVGIDPITHYAIVAFSNATLGFIVNVNPNATAANSPACFLSSQTPPCAIASVSLNTGAYPQIVLQPNAPLAYVTPGNSSATNGFAGVTSVVNLLLTNNTVGIAPAPTGVTCAGGSNIATVTTTTPNNLNQSFPGAVLIQGVSPTTPINFNGTYNVLTATTYTFTISLPTGVTCPNPFPSAGFGGGSVTFGNPYYTFSTTQGATGASINPVTRDFAFADPNSSIAQIGFIRTLDQTVGSLFLTLGSCNGCTPIPSSTAETGMRSVAWDPYTNLLIGYDPKTDFDLISLINPGGSTATGSQSPYRIIQAISTCPPSPPAPVNSCQQGQGSYTPAGATSPVTVFGPMVYDPKTNLVLVAEAGSNTLTYLDLDPGATFKKVSIQDVQLQLTPWDTTNKLNPNGGIPSAQPPLASTPGAPTPLPVAICDPTQPTNPYATCLPQAVTVGRQAFLRVLGQGFLSGGAPVVRLDGDSTGITITNTTDAEIDITVAASRFPNPHDFALDVLSGSVQSNSQTIYAVGIVDLSATCSSADMPEAVTYDFIRNVALVTNFGCNSVSVLNMDSTNAFNYGVPYGSVMSTVAVGTNPLGIDVIPRLGYAVVANNGDGSASILDISNPLTPKQLSFASANCTTSAGTKASTNICVGIAPSGVAIYQDRALALVANTGGNSVSSVDLTPLLQTNTSACPGTPPTCVPSMQLVATSGPPNAIAVDPNRAEAVVTNIQNSGTTSAVGGLDVISLATVPPTRSSTASINTITANPTSIVYDPSITPALFYASSTQQNAIYAFNPDTSVTVPIRVGVNPYSLGYNYQTGTMLSINSTSNTSSVIDTVNASRSVVSTRNTLGIGSQSQFAVAVDNFTNNAIIADQNNNRVLILALPQ